MHKDNLNHTISIDDALSKIKSNNSRGFIWFMVENRKGSKFELGGSSEGRLQLKAYIPDRTPEGEIICYPNDFIKSSNSIGTECNIHLNDGLNMSEEQFLKTIRNFDHKTHRFEKVEEEYVERNIRVMTKLIKN
jgi:hypothetical protein